MVINPLDKSNYFKGLLVLVGKDKEINRDERDLIKKIVNILGFNHVFVELAIKNYFNNKYIIDEPPSFSNYSFAEIFIKDGIRMALINNAINLDQIKWLETAAVKNHLSKQWLFIELESLLERNKSGLEFYFEIQRYLNHLYDDISFVY